MFTIQNCYFLSFVVGSYIRNKSRDNTYYTTINRMVDFNSVKNSRDCRADKSQIARSREIGPLQNVKRALFFCFEFSNVLF